MLAALAVLGSASLCFFKTSNLSASALFHPSCFTSPASSAAMSFVFIFDGIFSGFFAADAPTSIFLDFPGASPVSSAALLDDDAASLLGAGVLDLSRCAVPLNAGGSDFSDSIRRPAPLKGIGPGVPLRPLVGLGATMVSMGGSACVDCGLSLFAALAEGPLLLARAFAAGCAGVASAAALDELAVD